MRTHRLSMPLCLKASSTLAIVIATMAMPAVAQTQVSLYGLLDVSAERISGDGFSLSRVSSSNLSTSRLGLRADEDLGGGLKVRATLETAVAADTGANSGGNSRFFDRHAHVALIGSWGELRLGRTDTPLGLAADMAGTQAFDDLTIVGARGATRYRRTDNSITYLLPTVITGLSGQVQYSLGSSGFGGSGLSDNRVTGDEATGGKTWGFNLVYAAGPFQAGLGYLKARDENIAVAGDQGANATMVLASYDFGPVKITAYANDETNTSVISGADHLRTLGAKLAVPVGQDLLLTAGASRTRGTTDARGDEDRVTIFSLKGVYTLSRRTSLYGWLVSVDNEDAANKGVIAPGAGQSGRGLAFGVRHLF
ncbi:porin [Aquabacterium soli]|uniref:Porin n=2 Tax=Aquabacterium soli TaxID=2493092 RepID=A0A3R8TVB4_9BURK|nr:porin [Aquabacterium soli]